MMSEDEEDLDFEIIPKRAFPMGEVPPNWDPTAAPTSGLEYLYQVRYETQRCPEIVKADIDTSKFNRNQTVKVSSSNDCKPAPVGYAPTPEWQRKQVNDFSSLRMQLVSKKELFRKQSKSIKLPKINDISAWYRFCFGKQVVDEGTSKDKHCDGNLPLLSNVSQLIQPDIEKLLSHHITWLKNYGFSHRQGCWIYALLTCLEKPLTPNAFAHLRNLVRICTELRSKLESKSDDFLKPLNLLICLVAIYFEQLDMCDVTFMNNAVQGDEEEEEDGDDDGMDEEEIEDDSCESQ